MRERHRMMRHGQLTQEALRQAGCAAFSGGDALSCRVVADPLCPGCIFSARSLGSHAGAWREDATGGRKRRRRRWRTCRRWLGTPKLGRPSWQQLRRARACSPTLGARDRCVDRLRLALGRSSYRPASAHLRAGVVASRVPGGVFVRHPPTSREGVERGASSPCAPQY